ncbi:hypothetical protein ACFPU0_14515 [Pseudomonas sp. GCM10022186]|uniref:hypothetical protein n=1 Tax=Pseudomonas sp. GCM10022186 TaxID=3252650 RepID=UPI00361B6394
MSRNFAGDHVLFFDPRRIYHDEVRQTIGLAEVGTRQQLGQGRLQPDFQNLLAEGTGVEVPPSVHHQEPKKAMGMKYGAMKQQCYGVALR